jgi:hypothetical protein
MVWWFTILFWTFINFGLGYVIFELTKQKQKVPDVAPDAFDMPETKEGTKYTIGFGTFWIENAVVDWWGDTGTDPVYEHYHEPSFFGSGKKKYYIVAHRYKVGVHFRICQGVCDGIKQIKMGEAVAWPDSSDKTVLQADGATTATIDELGLFGGDKEEGGVQGTISIQYGYSGQAANSYLTGLFGANISASRGFTSATYEQVIVGTSPYLKPPKFLLKRTDVLTTGESQWYLTKAEPVTGTLNGIHIIRECLTNASWGLGYAESVFPAAIWEAAADDLYDEDFGLSMKWESPRQTLEEFIKDVLHHIDAELYQNLETGEIYIKLVRDDYVVGDLEEFDETDATVKEYGQTLLGEVPSTIWVKYWNTLDNKPAMIQDDDIALMDQQGGGTIEAEMTFYGVTSDALASKIAARERLFISTFPVSMTLKSKRTMAHLRPGDVFKFIYAPLFSSQVILRIVDAKYGTLRDGHVTLKCVTDTFALEDGLYAIRPATGWTDPRSDPVDVDEYKLIETPFYDIALDRGVVEADALDDDSDFLMAMAGQPTSDSLDYQLLMRYTPTSDFLEIGFQNFTPFGRLVSDMPMNAANVEIELYDHMALSSIVVGIYAMIGDEIVKVTALNIANNKVTVARGCLDTIPAAHDGQAASAGGDYVWFSGGISFIAAHEYTVTDTPGVKFLTRTPKGSLTAGSATIYTASAFGSRQTRPYPPGDFKVDGASYPVSFVGEPTITWTHRDRTQQLGLIVEHSAASIGPEAGVTYTLTIHDENDVQCRQVTGLTGTSYTYTNADEMSDCGIPSAGALNTKLRFKLKAVRGGYDSWQEYDIWVNRA